MSDPPAPIDLTLEGVVSVWIAPRISADELAQAFEPEGPTLSFGAHMGLSHIDLDFLEISFEEQGAELFHLLEGVSFASSFRASVVDQAQSRAMNRANAVILLYDVQFTPGAETERKDLFQFLGVFPYDPAAED